jgi:hypothetical protein
MAKTSFNNFGVVVTRFFRLLLGKFSHTKKNHCQAGACLPKCERHSSPPIIISTGVFTRSIGSRIGFLRCCFPLLVGQSLIRVRKILLGRPPVDLQPRLQLHFYDLQSSERDKQGPRDDGWSHGLLDETPWLVDKKKTRKSTRECVIALNATTRSLGLPRWRPREESLDRWL